MPLVIHPIGRLLVVFELFFGYCFNGLFPDKMTSEAQQNAVAIETDTTTEDLLKPEFLRKLLETIATREGFADGFKLISRSGSNVEGGYQGQLVSVVITGYRNGYPNVELPLVCKIPPFNERRKKMAASYFRQEINAYESFLPALIKFQKDKGIKEADGFFAFPKCYGTYSDEETLDFAIIMEDLQKNGYRMWNKYETIDYRHVQLALTQLGRFHALSFALRQQQPDAFAKFQSLGPNMYKVMYDFPGTSSFLEKNFDRAINALRPEDTDEIRKMTHLRHHFKANFRSAVSGAEAEPFTVFCHGDFWNNNMMFQYSSAESLEPQRAILIDWQILQYCSPVTDLSYYLYSSTEQSLRTDHFEDILHDYHDSLAVLLQRLGGNAEKQFSYGDLHSQLETFGIYGIIMAPILVQVVTVKAEDMPNMDDFSEEEFKDFDFMEKCVPDAYKIRVRDVIRDFVGRGYFGEKHLALKYVQDDNKE